MPGLDVSFVTADPLLADTFRVRRREDVMVNGRSVPTVVATFDPVVGVVTQQAPAEIMRREEGQLVPRRIFIAASFAFRGESQLGGTQYQPDLVDWNGTTYLVKEVLSYGRYGGGTWEVVCESMTAVDVPQ